MNPETALTRAVLARHGARPDLRLFRNESGVFWAGSVKGRTRTGDLVLARASRVTAGLAVGSSDLIGFTNTGRFIAIELKTKGKYPTPQQKLFLALVSDWGGLAGVVRSVEDADALLGPPPARGRP